MFQAALGITVDDAEWLREAVLRATYEEEAKISAPSPFGVKYVIDVVVTHGELSALVRTAWIVD